VVTVLPALLAAAGLGLLLVTRRPGRAQGALWLLVSWLAIAPLFLLVNYRVDMIGKHLFFTMLPIAVAGGIYLAALARRRRLSSLLAGLVFTLLAWQGIVFWLDRIVRASS
jgi:hypothetical protein